MLDQRPSPPGEAGWLGCLRAPGDVVRIIGVRVLGMYALVLAIGT